MGILRADRVSGLGGANAINGSVSFSVHSWMNVEPHDDLTLGSGDFTIECWINVSQLVLYGSIFSYRPKSTNGVYLDVHYNSGWNLYVNSSYVISGGGASGTSTLNTWAHLALCKSGSSTKLFVDGAQVGSTYSDSNTYLAATEGIALGALGYNRNGNEPFPGHISNFRIIKGEALYTSAFTVPAQRLTKTANTVLLCCQSPGDVLKEETGKTITVKQSSTAVSFPKASRFAPDVGEDYGTTFEDNTKFDTKSYMVPPGGTTAESNRGRAVFAGGYTGPSPGNGTTVIDYFNIQSGGIVQSFGTLSEDRKFSAGLASATRGVFGGSDGTPGWATGTMEYLTIATTSNTTSFGNMTQVGGMVSAHSNNTRGLFFSVWDANTSGASHKRHIDYITIASAGNGADFGELTAARPEATGFGSPTRGICSGGYAALSPNAALNTIDYVTIATTGDATDFGDITVARQALGGASSETRGIFAGGYASPTGVNTMDYVTIATTGNATDFGDTISTPFGLAQGNCSNKIRAVFAGGKTSSPTWINSISYVDIATTGNASDFGDLTGTYGYGSACSDSHGGIS